MKLSATDIGFLVDVNGQHKDEWLKHDEEAAWVNNYYYLLR